jgi:hypothetical protein
MREVTSLTCAVTTDENVRIKMADGVRLMARIWGPVTAEVARTVVRAQRGAEWRYAVTDADGQLLHAGITRRRPHRGSQGSGPQDSGPQDSGPPPCRGGIVELHIPLALLNQLAADPDAHGAWAAVSTDIAGQYARRGPLTQDPSARFAGAALRRPAQIRDRFCVFMGCRCPARRADVDHTVDHATGDQPPQRTRDPIADTITC